MLAAVDRANAALRVDETSAQVVPDIGERNTESQQIYRLSLPPSVRTESKQESLDGSLLTYMGSSASEADLREVCWLMISPQPSDTEL